MTTIMTTRIQRLVSIIHAYLPTYNVNILYIIIYYTTYTNDSHMMRLHISERSPMKTSHYSILILVCILLITSLYAWHTESSTLSSSVHRLVAVTTKAPRVTEDKKQASLSQKDSTTTSPDWSTPIILSTDEQHELTRLTEETKAATTAFQQGDYPHCIELAEKTIQMNPTNYVAYSLLGVAEALQGDTQQGLTDTTHAYELQPRYIANFYNMAMVYKLNGQLQDARLWFERLLVTDPAHTWSLYGIATIYADTHNHDQALAYLKRAIDTDPTVKEVARTQDHFAAFHGDPAFERLVQ